ncbi:HK97 gp10 family phage protein [Sedimentibacter sp.]|uniref:HK97 gp10 family phage protein n=1 Tax=Sedimentibacter sp. TaxID=1960295 RepID=UPI0028AEAD34|nr:HK97 gp10 family phage protein [Sedimentibacter sp.]
MPKSVTKYSNKNGVTFTSSVDRVNYTIQELSRAALKDVAKVIRKKMIIKLKELPGMKKNKRLYSSTQYWVRKKETDLQVGFKHNTWYGVLQELGGDNQPKRSILRDTVFESIDEIQKIEAQYLSAIEDELKAQALINEDEEVGDNEDVGA